MLRGWSIINQHEWNFIENFGLLFERKGGTRSLGRVFAYLMLADRPKTLDDIAEDLLFSKATASLTVRQGVVGGFFEKVSIPGERKILFRVSAKSWIDMTVEQVNWISEWDQLMVTVLKNLAPDNQMARTNLNDFKEFLGFIQWYFADIPKKFERWKAERDRKSSPSAMKKEEKPK
jgi:DNA-binding transcriptional regulator GbsR (MarR family)